MAEEKTLGFSVVINGISNENVEMQKLNIQLQNLNKEYKDLQTTIKQQGGLASNQQLQQLAAYSKEINNHKDSVKELNRVMDSAPDSLNRMRASLIQLKEQYANGSATLRDQLTPQIQKLTTQVSVAEQAIGVHTRGVGSYAQGIKSAASNLLGFTGIVGGVILVMNKLKESFASTETGLRVMSQTSSIFKQLWYDIINGSTEGGLKGLLKDLILSSSDAQRLDDFRIKERASRIEMANQELAIEQLKLQATNLKQGSVEQITKLKLADELENIVIKEKTDDLKTYIGILKDLLVIAPENTKVLDELNAKQLELIRVQGDKSLRIASKIATLEDKKDKEDLIDLTDKQVSGIRAVILAEQEQMRQENRQKIMNTVMSGPHYGLTGVLAVKIKKETQESVDGIGNIIDKANAKEISNAQKIADEKVRIETNLYNQKRDLINGAEGMGAALFQRQFANLDKQYNAEIKAAGDNAAKKAQIDEVYNKKKSDLARKAAIAEKIAGLFSVGIDTAKGIANAASKIITIPLIPWIIANGIIQAGIILAKPIPQFARGGKINRGVSINTGTVDDTLIAVNKTETVLTQRHVAALGGSGAMHRIGVPGYASGGYVGQQATAMPPSEIDYDKLAEANRRYLNVVLDINKLNQAQNELAIITTTNRI